MTVLRTIVTLQTVQRLHVQDTRTQPLRIFLVDESTMPPSAYGTATPPPTERSDEPRVVDRGLNGIRSQGDVAAL